MTSSAAIAEDAVECTELAHVWHSREILDGRLKNVSKIMFGKHELNFEMIEPDEFCAEKAKKELRETPEIRAQGYKELRELIAGEPDLYLPDVEEFYEIFLRPCKWYPKSAFSLIKRHYRFRQNYSRIFFNLVPSKQKIGLASGVSFPLPLRGKDGCRIVVIEGGKRWKPKETPIEDCFKALLCILCAGMMEPNTQIAGTRIIIDVEGLSLSQITYITPTFAKMVVDFVQKALPTRLKSIHILNQSFIFNMAFAIFKPFLEEKIRNRIHFHGTNWESLMTFIDKKALLKRHGGELDMPEEGYGFVLWQGFLLFEPSFEVIRHQGYKSSDKK